MLGLIIKTIFIFFITFIDKFSGNKLKSEIHGLEPIVWGVIGPKAGRGTRNFEKFSTDPHQFVILGPIGTSQSMYLAVRGSLIPSSL